MQLFDDPVAIKKERRSQAQIGKKGDTWVQYRNVGGADHAREEQLSMETSSLLPDRYSRRSRRYDFWLGILLIGLTGLGYSGVMHSTAADLAALEHRARLHRSKNLQATPLINRCEKKYLTQNLDHFGASNITFQQRYFVCAEFWSKPDGPIFFYVGNEANVELYLNHTGLMWENAQDFHAMLVFAEHRYFGDSLPFGPQKVTQHMSYLSSEQALADYAALIRVLKHEYDANNAAVIGFGGSYGGMLASWFRMKYPHIVDGVIAASAPILSFEGEQPPIDPAAFYRVVTYDATEGAGSKPNCAKNIRKVWDPMFALGRTVEGRATLTSIFGLCTPLKSEQDVYALASWIQEAYSSMAMGNYPYPSSYIMNGDSNLPAYPVRVACERLAADSYSSIPQLFQAVRASVAVYYNNTGLTKCYDLNPPNAASKQSNDFWGYLYCTEMCQPFDANGVTDMFWPTKQNWYVHAHYSTQQSKKSSTL